MRVSTLLMYHPHVAWQHESIYTSIRTLLMKLVGFSTSSDECVSAGGRRRILNKDYTLLRDDQDPDDVEESNKKSGASAWRLVGLAKEQAFVRPSSQMLSQTASRGSRRHKADA